MALDDLLRFVLDVGPFEAHDREGGFFFDQGHRLHLLALRLIAARTPRAFAVNTDLARRVEALHNLGVRVSAHVDKIYPFTAAASAFGRLSGRQAMGKVLLKA